MGNQREARISSTAHRHSNTICHMDYQLLAKRGTMTLKIKAQLQGRCTSRLTNYKDNNEPHTNKNKDSP